VRAFTWVGVGFLVGAFLHPVGYFLVAWGAWTLRSRSRLALWLVGAALCAGLGQLDTWGTAAGAPWSVGAVAGLVSEVLACTILIQLATDRTTQSRGRLLRLALVVSYVACAIAWAPTGGHLGEMRLLDAAIFLTLMINMCLTVLLGGLLIPHRLPVDGRDGADSAQAGAGVEVGQRLSRG